MAKPTINERLQEIDDDLKRIVEELWDLEHRRQGSRVFQAMRRIRFLMEDVEGGMYDKGNEPAATNEQ